MEGTDHTDTSHDAGWAYAIGLIGLFVVLATLSVPFFLDETWYAPWRLSTATYAVVQGQPVVVQPATSSQKQDMKAGLVSAAAVVVVSPGNVIVPATSADASCVARPDLSSLRCGGVRV